jgi:hypothetical protein
MGNILKNLGTKMEIASTIGQVGILMKMMKNA